MNSKSLLLLTALCGLLVRASFAGNWTEVPPPQVLQSNNIHAVAAVSDDDVWAVGDLYDSGYVTLTEHWDGASWSVVPSPNGSTKNNLLFGVTALSSRNVWAVGNAVHGRVAQTLVLHWNGTGWAVVPSPNVAGDGVQSFLLAISAVSPNDIWTLGSSSALNQNSPLAIHWDGAGWTIIPTPSITPATLFAVEAIAANDVWAVGSAGSSTLTLHWDGVAWSVIPSPNVDANYNVLRGVSASTGNDVWAAGYSGLPGVNGQTLALHWDGPAWSVIPTPAGSGDANFSAVVAILPGNVWAVGQDHQSGQPLTERWNGTAWKLVPVPPVGNESHLDSISFTRTGTIWAIGSQNVDADQLILMKPR
jgi:hypothetical protein